MLLTMAGGLWVGLVQALWLRRHLPLRPAIWTIATAVGPAVTMATMLTTMTDLGNLAAPLSLAISADAQWMVLRPHVEVAWTWPAAALGTGALMACLGLLIPVPPEASALLVPVIMGQVLGQLVYPTSSTARTAP